MPIALDNSLLVAFEDLFYPPHKSTDVQIWIFAALNRYSSRFQFHCVTPLCLFRMMLLSDPMSSTQSYLLWCNKMSSIHHFKCLNDITVSLSYLLYLIYVRITVLCKKRRRASWEKNHNHKKNPENRQNYFERHVSP